MNHIFLLLIPVVGEQESCYTKSFHLTILMRIVGFDCIVKIDEGDTKFPYAMNLCHQRSRNYCSSRHLKLFT
jgi:hypothetical protein